MTNIDLPYFGQIDFTQLDEYYAAEAAFSGSILNLDLNFESRSVSEEQATTIKNFLGNISAFDLQNTSAIRTNFSEDGEAADYISFYLDELDKEELAGIIGNNTEDISKGEQLLKKLRLIRVGLYPDGKYDSECYGVFDYSIDIDGEPCNELLVVKTNEKGEIDHITWES